MTKHDFDFCGNLTVRPEMIGAEALLSPFPAFTSPTRSMMFSGHLPQCQIVSGAETPLIGTGYESVIGGYDLNETVIEEESIILDIIPKYQIGGGNSINLNPDTVIVYKNIATNVVKYFHNKTYTLGTDNYGYLNKPLNQHQLVVGQYIPEGTKFSSSHINLDNEYKYGVNANVAYMTIPEVDEDAFIISRSLANKMRTIGISKLNISLRNNQIPLNMYGNREEYKFIPNIGETVNDNGIICAFRTPTKSSFATDMTDESLSHIQYAHDECYYVPNGAVVLDLDFYINKPKNIQETNKLYQQVLIYNNLKKNYYIKIVDCYSKCFKEGYGLSPAFNTLITNAMFYMMVNKDTTRNFRKVENISLLSGKKPIRFINMELTYMYTREVTKGFKLTDRYGAKGVVGDIWEDAHMPTDSNGFVADVIIDPKTVVNRMNPSQLWETSLNRYSELVRKDSIEIRKVKDDNKAYEYISKYIELINPNYLKIINASCSTAERKTALLDDIEAKGLFLIIPPFLDTLSRELIVKLEEVYGSRLSGVKYSKYDNRTGKYRHFNTKSPIHIGAKYMVLLYKMPRCMASGLGYINHFRTPSKPPSNPSSHKKRSPISQTPIRFGEDELRYFLTVGKSPQSAIRLYALTALSPQGRRAMAMQLLTDTRPALIDKINISNEELIKTNAIVDIFDHMFSTLGIDTNDLTSEVKDVIDLPPDIRPKTPTDAVRELLRARGYGKNGT